MEASFWHQKWERGETGFHENEINPFLIKHFEALNPPKGGRIFLPLCGKTRDIGWFLANGYQIIGAELSERAIHELFTELGITPEISKDEKLTRYRAENLDILAGDFFDVSAESLGPISAIYDRAALVALPAPMRKQYSSHLMHLTDAAPQLLITYEYNQLMMDGPPFSVSEDEVKQLYSAAYRLESAESKIIAGGLKGKAASTETAWVLHKIKQ